MPTPLPLPIRVLAKGPSLVNWTYPMGGPRTDFTFPRVIERQLLTDGRPCEVRAITMTSELASDLLKNWQREVLGYSPDVIITFYGGYESVHLFLPRWLEFHANSLRARPRLRGRLYRRFLLRPVWKMLAQLQLAVDQRFPTFRKAATRRFVADMEAYIKQVQQIGSPLVLMLEMHHNGGRSLKWFPGTPARVDMVNEAVRDMVARLDKPNVRLFGVNELIDKHLNGELDAAISDGFHYSPDMHRIVGEALAHEIGEWAATQPHLALPAENED